jgi:hypothetical protein
VPSRAHGAVPLPVRSPLPSPPHRRARARPRSTLHVHTLHTTTAAPLHTHKASHGARGGCGGADAAVAAAPTSADGGPWGRLGSCTASSESAESVVAATAGSAAAAESVAAAAEISGGDTAAALAVLAVAAVAAVRGGADLDGEQCACSAHASALPRPFSSPPLGHRIAWSKHLCKSQRKLVSNCKSKKWSMLGSGKHFAIGKREARRVWHLRVDRACCTQEAIALR